MVFCIQFRDTLELSGLTKVMSGAYKFVCDFGLARMAHKITTLRKEASLIPASAGIDFGALVSMRLEKVEALADKMAAAIVNGLDAKSRMFNLATKEMEEFPDHKTRLHAFTTAMEHMVGKPVERQIVKHINEPGQQVDEAETMRRLAESPALREAMKHAIAEVEEGQPIPATVEQIPATESTDAPGGF